MSSTHPTRERSPAITARVGVLGGGQLGRMLALAGHPLGVDLLCVDPSPTAPAAAIARHVAREHADPEALAMLAECDVVTYEFENVPVTVAEALARRTRVSPPPEALRVAQDRLLEKECFRALGIPTPDFAAVDSQSELEAGCAALGFPAVLKTRRLGYDGKGQRVLRSRGDLDGAWAALGGVPCILEQFVAFERELSLLVVRGRDGSTVHYPLVENEHQGGILRVTRAPASGVTPALQARAADYGSRLCHRLDYVGVLALELFEVGGELVANEMAPRVHNSGHFTIEGARTSQFENHLRAILGLPLGSPEVPEPCAMLNCVGVLPEVRAVLAVPGAHLHLYGKAPRAGRKVGHVTVTGEHQLAERIAQLRALPGVG
ncbi:MAG: 5-(carboxyamino)imidazole ribonucleotide synthase [Pseudomonadota bacterium]